MNFLLRNVIVGALALPLFVAHAQKVAVNESDINKSSEIASSLSNTVKGQTNSASSLNSSQIRPVVGETKMKTLDGKTEFNGQVMCKGSSEFLKVIGQPMGNGDLRILNIMQDANMDGKLDTVYSPNYDVSAVCSNGFMTCSNPNETTTCTSWGWIADSKTYQLGRQRVAMTDLGGCYCINNQCGSSLAWRNMGQILSDLGGGATQALAKVNPFFAVSAVSVDGVTATFTGGDGGACAMNDSDGFFNSSSGQTALKYNSNANQMSNDANAQKQSSKAYQAIVGGSFNPDESYDLKSCEVNRIVPLDEPKLNDIIQFDGGEGSVQSCGNDCLQLVLGKEGDNYWSGSCKYYEVKSNFILKDPTRIASATLVNAQFDDWMQVWKDDKVIWNGPYGTWNDAGPVPGKCELGTNWNMNPNLDFRQHFNKAGPIQFKIRVEVSGDGEGYALVRIKADLSCKEGQERTVNTCAVYEQDDGCHLVDENVDGVTTFSGGINTGLTAIKPTQTLTGNFCSIVVQRPWFTKKRTYRCNKKTAYNFDNIIERKAYIDKTVTPGDYKDKMFSNGNVSYGAGELFWPKMPTVGDCTNVCKTRKVKETPDMTVSGTTDKTRTGANVQYNYYYHECDTSNQCPAEAGEEVVKACQCMNEFAEAAAIMQTMRQAGQDMICTSGEKKNPDGSKPKK
ncbi:conjugal transfer protein TraN [Pantoea ananatis]